METVKPNEDYLSNVPRILFLNGLWCLLLIMPVIIPFFESRGMNMAQVYQLQAVFGIGILIFEVPSGYLSDLWGRKNALLLAVTFHAIGFGLFAISDNFNHLVVAELFLALAVSLFSGTDLSLLYDSLLAFGSKKAPIKLVGRKIYFQQTGEAIGGLIGGWLILISLESVAWAQAFAALLPFLAVIGIKEPPRIKMDKKKHKENFVYVYNSMFKHSRLLNLIIFNMVFYSLSTLAAVWMFQKYWQEIHIPLLYFGYLWAASNLAVAVVGRYAHKLEKKWGSVSILYLISLLPVVGYLGMGLVEAVWGFIFCFLFQVSRALKSVVLQDALNKRVSSDMRATANSVASLLGRSAFIILGPAVGYSVDKWGISTTCLGLAVVYAFCFVLVMVPFLRQRENFDPIR